MVKNDILNGSYQKYCFNDFLNTDFFNKRIALYVYNINDLSLLKSKLLDVYGDIEIYAYNYDNETFTFVSKLEEVEEIVIMPIELTKAIRFDFSDFVSILKRLMAPDGCEWDRAQTHESIRINLIEEAYELVDAIDQKDISMMLEESGDVLMQAAFHTQLAVKNNEFNYCDMLTNLCRKLIDRHTHIFGENHANTPEEALKFWNEAKKKEKKYQSTSDAMNRIPKNLPALLYAEKIQKLAKKSGFDWPDVTGALEKVYEEANELKDAEEINKLEEAGDLLFAVVNVLRFYHIDPEMALHEANKKFYRRYSGVEELALKRGIDMKNTSLEVLDSLWEEVKSEE